VAIREPDGIAPHPQVSSAGRGAMTQEPVLVVRLKELLRLLGLSRSMVLNMVREKEFPAPIQLGPRAIGWRRADIEAWVKGRPTV
jgi:prophage regulatory protein